MTDDTHIADELGGMEKKENKIIKSLETIADNTTDNKKIKGTVKKLANVNTQRIEDANQTTKHNNLKVGSSILYEVFKTPIFIYLSYSLITKGNQAIPYLYKLIHYLVKFALSFFNDVYITWITMLLTFPIILTILIFAFPYVPFEYRVKNTERMWLPFLIAIFSIIIYGLLTANGMKTTVEAGQIILDDAKENTRSLWKVLTCLSPECLQEMQNKKEAEESEITYYEIRFKNVPQIPKELNKIQEKPVTLYYDIASSGEMKITGIRCYHTKKAEENMFYEETGLDYVIQNTHREAITFSKVKCDMSGFTYLNKKEIEEVTIIPELELEVETTINMKIPIVSQPKYFEEFGIESSENSLYSNPDFLNYYRNSGVVFEIIKSNDAIDMEASYIENIMPLIYGDDEAQEFEIPLLIKENTQNSFGKLTKIQTIGQMNIPGIFQLGEGNTDDFEETQEKNKFVRSLILIEEESVSGDLPLTITVHDLSFKVNSQFRKEDRFKVSVKDPNWKEKLEAAEAKENDDGESKSSSGGPSSSSSSSYDNMNAQQLDQEFNTLSNKFDGLQIDYLNLENTYDEIETKINNIEYFVNSMKSDIEVLRYNVTQYKTRLNTLKTDIDSLETMITEKAQTEAAVAQQNSESDYVAA